MDSPALQGPVSLLFKVIRWSARTVVFAIVVTLTLATLVLTYEWFEKLPTPARTWAVLQPVEGLKISLKTISIAGQVHYQFSAEPSGAMKPAFQKAAELISRRQLFTVILKDKDGFEVCRHTLDVVDVEDYGGLAGFSSAGSFSGCDGYSRVAGWDVEYASSLRQLKKVEVALNVEKTRPAAREGVNSDAKRPVLVVATEKQRTEEDRPFIFEETLIGSDPLSGLLETVSGRTVTVSTNGRMTAAIWANASRLKFTCMYRDCTVLNLSNGEIVRATLRR